MTLKLFPRFFLSFFFLSSLILRLLSYRDDFSYSSEHLKCPEFECLFDVRDIVILHDLVDDIQFGQYSSFYSKAYDNIFYLQTSSTTKTRWSWLTGWLSWSALVFTLLGHSWFTRSFRCIHCRDRVSR